MRLKEAIEVLDQQGAFNMDNDDILYIVSSKNDIPVKIVFEGNISDHLDIEIKDFKIGFWEIK